MHLPDNFRRTITDTFAGGAAWLDQLHTIIHVIADRWSLSVDPPFNNLSYNYVAPTTLSDGTQAVLKLGPPNPELNTEIQALRLYNGQGAALLLESDVDLGALLTERLHPGQILATIEDDQTATSIAANIMQQLWRPLPPNHPFPTLERWFQALTEHRYKFNGTSGPIPSDLFSVAESLYHDLISSQSDPVLLHGDIHHFNILSSDRAPWLAIDPKGIAGDPAFDTAQYLLNPWPKLLDQPNPGEVLSRRIHQFSEELGFDSARVRGWGICNAVLSACWDAEKPQVDHRYDLQIAALLSQIQV